VKILVTGATGYIGRRFVRGALSHGHVVVAASRRPPPPGCEWITYALGDDVAVPLGVDVIVHLAADTTGGADSSDLEFRAAASLVAQATSRRMMLVFVSSQTSRPNAETAYGRIKWEIDQHVLASDGWVVRPGQVYGGEEAGLFGTLVATVRSVPLIPALLPSPLIQPIHVDDCVAGLLSIVERRPHKRVFHLAAPEPVTFTSFLRHIANKRLGKFIVPVPVPTFLLKAVIWVAGTVGWSPVALVKVRSLLSVPLVQSGPDLESLALNLRPLRSGMSRSGGHRRELLSEAFGLLGYILRRRPTRRLLISYVRAVEALRDGRAIGLPRWMLSSPSLIALLDSPHIVNSREELLWRFEAATLIAEASPTGFSRFMRDGRASAPLPAAWRMTRSLLSEICWRLVRILARPVMSGLLYSVSENRRA
jgi:uncharacterized protein YbjT (DUF2867 family)